MHPSTFIELADGTRHAIGSVVEKELTIWSFDPITLVKQRKKVIAEAAPACDMVAITTEIGRVLKRSVPHKILGANQRIDTPVSQQRYMPWKWLTCEHIHQGDYLMIPLACGGCGCIGNCNCEVDTSKIINPNTSMGPVQTKAGVWYTWERVYKVSPLPVQPTCTFNMLDTSKTPRVTKALKEHAYITPDGFEHA